jgi:lipid-A-disaccharide synthase-like uncharacterized protein
MMPIMDWLRDLVWHDGNLFGIHWSAWKAIGWAGNVIFFSRFLVQWYATEKLKRVVVPAGFWWLSLAGTLLLFSYAAFKQRDSVFIFAYAFSWIPYIRNLIIHYRHKQAHLECPGCGEMSPPQANFCLACGAALPKENRRFRPSSFRETKVPTVAKEE